MTHVFFYNENIKNSTAKIVNVENCDFRKCDLEIAVMDLVSSNYVK